LGDVHTHQKCFFIKVIQNCDWYLHW